MEVNVLTDMDQTFGFDIYKSDHKNWKLFASGESNSIHVALFNFYWNITFSPSEGGVASVY